MAKIQSKQKGNRGEREVAKIFNDKFKGEFFKRAPFSGAFIGGNNRKNACVLTDEQQLAFASDIICPDFFRFVIEHKSYASIDFWELFNESSNLNSWIAQVSSDADFVKKDPMLIVKINNHKRIVFIKEEVPNYKFEYKGWYCYWLDDLLAMPDTFFHIIHNV